MSEDRKVRRRLGIPRIKFIFGAAKELPGRWFFGLIGFYDRTEAQRQQGIAISVRGLLLWLAALGVAAYVAGAGLLYYLWSRNSYSILTYGDALLYPIRREPIAEKKGQAFIAQGLDLWKAQKYHEAATLLRLGLERHPRDIRARTSLAQYYLLLNRRSVALSTLLAGLTAEYPGRAYLQSIFEIAEQGDDFGQILEVCARYRSAVEVGRDVREQRWLESRYFSALIAAGRSEEALRLASERAEWSELASEQRVLALFALRRPEDAIKFLSEWQARVGADLQIVTRLQVRAYREAKRFADMDRAIASLKKLSPGQAAPFVYGTVQLAMAGRLDDARAALEEYLFRFGKTTADLQLVAEPLAEVGALALVERCRNAARERGYPAQPFQLLLVQLHVERGDWAAAAEDLKKVVLPSTPGRNTFAVRSWHDWMRNLIEAAQSPAEQGQVALLEFLRQRPWPLKIYRKTAEALRQAERRETERDVLNLALAGYPASSWLQDRKEVLAKEFAAQAAAVAAAQPAGVTDAVKAKRWTEPAFVAQLSALLANAKWDEAEELIRLIRDNPPAPAWFARRDETVRLALVRIAHGRGSTSELTAAARVYLTTEISRLNALLELAREYYRAGDKAAGLLLVREVLRKSPDFPPAKRQLAEWEPKKAGK